MSDIHIRKLERQAKLGDQQARTNLISTTSRSCPGHKGHCWHFVTRFVFSTKPPGLHRCCHCGLGKSKHKDYKHGLHVAWYKADWSHRLDNKVISMGDTEKYHPPYEVSDQTLELKQKKYKEKWALKKR